MDVNTCGKLTLETEKYIIASVIVIYKNIRNMSSKCESAHEWGKLECYAWKNE